MKTKCWRLLVYKAKAVSRNLSISIALFFAPNLLQTA